MSIFNCSRCYIRYKPFQFLRGYRIYQLRTFELQLEDMSCLFDTPFVPFYLTQYIFITVCLCLFTVEWREIWPYVDTILYRLRWMAPYDIELIARNSALKIQIWRSLLFHYATYSGVSSSMRALTNADNKMLVEWISLGEFDGPWVQYPRMCPL